jgi:hypothetical protein
MLKSDSERMVRRAIEDTDAKFTEEQIQALSQMILKIVSAQVEEMLALWRPSGGGGGGGRPY